MPKKLGPAVIGFALTAALSLFTAAATVPMISADGPEARAVAAVPAAHRDVAVAAQDYTDAMRSRALTAPAAKGPDQETATKLIDLGSSSALADLADVWPGRTVPASAAGAEHAELIAAIEAFRQECLTELGRTYARGTSAPQVPPALAAAEARLLTAAEAADRAANLEQQRRADERGQVFQAAQRANQHLAIVAVIVFTILGLISATAAGIAFRLRRADGIGD